MLTLPGGPAGFISQKEPSGLTGREPAVL